MSLDLQKTLFSIVEYFSKEYSMLKTAKNVLEFCDLERFALKLLCEYSDDKVVKSKTANDISEKFQEIVIDEYQDISRQRFDLSKALSEVTDAKIIAVGDDWQSIYAFSGSDITLFTRFESVMGYAKLLKIVKTYRNSQEVIDIAGGFIQKNTEQNMQPT